MRGRLSAGLERLGRQIAILGASVLCAEACTPAGMHVMYSQSLVARQYCVGGQVVDFLIIVARNGDLAAHEANTQFKREQPALRRGE